MKKYNVLLISMAVLINELVALVFMRYSPTCYTYLEDEYASVEGILQLAIQVPLFWVVGIIAFIIVVLVSVASIEKTPSLLFQDAEVNIHIGYLLAAAGAIALTIFRWKTTGYWKKWVLITLLTILINPILLQSFFLLASV